MKKLSFTLSGLALCLFLGAASAAAQTGTVAKGPDESVARDPEAEKSALKSLDAARHYFKLRKAYVASLSRAEEILVGTPDFSRTDEVLYIAGMSSLYLSERKGKQAPPTSPPEKAQEYTPERLRAAASFNLSRLVENYPDSKFRKEAEATLKLLGDVKPKEAKAP
jgi:outer membrane protein assembly factor BamD (BamD/ComL family)